MIRRNDGCVYGGGVAYIKYYVDVGVDLKAEVLAAVGVDSR